MREQITGVDCHLTVEFGTSAAPVIADQGTVKFTVLDQTGQPIAGLTDVSVTTSPTSWAAEITVPAEYNTISAGRRFERRTVAVSWSTSGRNTGRVITYRVVPRLPHSLTAVDLRTFLGVNDGEVSDNEVDFLSAYLYVENDITPATLETALNSGTAAELAANKMILMQAALAILPSLTTRVAQSQADGPIQFTRPKIRDFSQIEQVARDTYLAAKDEILGVETSGGQLTLVLVTQDADPITG